MAARVGVSENKIIGALRKWGGIKSFAAKEVGMTRQCMHVRIEKSPKIKAALLEIEEETVDLGEGHVLKYLRDGDKDMVKYYLDRKGKRRGYGSNVQLGINEAQIEAIIRSLGGDPGSLRSALVALGVDPDQDP